MPPPSMASPLSAQQRLPELTLALPAATRSHSQVGQADPQHGHLLQPHCLLPTKPPPHLLHRTPCCKVMVLYGIRRQVCLLPREGHRTTDHLRLLHPTEGGTWTLQPVPWDKEVLPRS